MMPGQYGGNQSSGPMNNMPPQLGNQGMGQMQQAPGMLPQQNFGGQNLGAASSFDPAQSLGAAGQMNMPGMSNQENRGFSN